MNTELDNDTTAGIIAELSRRAADALTRPVKGSYLDAAPFIVLRDAQGAEKVHYLDGLTNPPNRKTGTVKLLDAESFIAYYGTHGNGAPVYATITPARFVAVLNEHTREAAGHRDHRADFTLSHSAEWTTWTKHNGRGAAFGSNEAFALFLEDNAPDIVKPDPATMLSIALNFRVKADAGFSIAQRLNDGNVELAFNNVVNASSKGAAGGTVKIPEVFVIDVPVFAGVNAPRYKVEARFRYRLADGKLTLWYELVRPHKVVERAFTEIWERIRKETKAPVLLGTPE